MFDRELPPLQLEVEDVQFEHHLVIGELIADHLAQTGHILISDGRVALR